MPRGIPKSQENGQTISKLEAVRRTLKDLGNDALPTAIQKHIKTKFHMDIQTAMISNYKSHLKSASKSAIIRTRSGSNRGAAFTVEDLQALKGLVNKYGSDQVRQFMEVLA